VEPGKEFVDQSEINDGVMKIEKEMHRW